MSREKGITRHASGSCFYACRCPETAAHFRATCISLRKDVAGTVDEGQGLAPHRGFSGLAKDTRAPSGTAPAVLRLVAEQAPRLFDRQQCLVRPDAGLHGHGREDL